MSEATAKLQNISGQSVFQIRNFTVPLDFEAASRYFLGWSRLAANDFPHGH